MPAALINLVTPSQFMSLFFPFRCVKGAARSSRNHNNAERCRHCEIIKSRASLFTRVSLFFLSFRRNVGSHHLRFCRSGNQATCCSETMESRLFDSSRQQYDSIVRNATASMSNAFTTRAKKFDGKPFFTYLNPSALGTLPGV